MVVRPVPMKVKWKQMSNITISWTQSNAARGVDGLDTQIDIYAWM
jgi:hypothetical protein